MHIASCLPSGSLYGVAYATLISSGSGSQWKHPTQSGVGTSCARQHPGPTSSQQLAHRTRRPGHRPHRWQRRLPRLLSRDNASLAFSGSLPSSSYRQSRQTSIMSRVVIRHPWQTLSRHLWHGVVASAARSQIAHSGLLPQLVASRKSRSWPMCLSTTSSSTSPCGSLRRPWSRGPSSEKSRHHRHQPARSHRHLPHRAPRHPRQWCQGRLRSHRPQPRHLG